MNGRLRVKNPKMAQFHASADCNIRRSEKVCVGLNANTMHMKACSGFVPRDADINRSDSEHESKQQSSSILTSLGRVKSSLLGSNNPLATQRQDL